MVGKKMSSQISQASFIGVWLLAYQTTSSSPHLFFSSSSRSLVLLLSFMSPLQLLASHLPLACFFFVIAYFEANLALPLLGLAERAAELLARVGAGHAAGVLVGTVAAVAHAVVDPARLDVLRLVARVGAVKHAVRTCRRP